MSLQDEIERQMGYAWAAGILDAKGRWFILPRGGWQGWQPRIVVPLKQRPDHNAVGERLTELFGGSIGKPKRIQRQWQVSGAKACAAMNAAVLPHLVRWPRVAKAHQHFCIRVTEYKRPSFEERRLPDQERDLRHALVDAFLKAELESQFP